MELHPVSKFALDSNRLYEGLKSNYRPGRSSFRGHFIDLTAGKAYGLLAKPASDPPAVNECCFSKGNEPHFFDVAVRDYETGNEEIFANIHQANRGDSVNLETFEETDAGSARLAPALSFTTSQIKVQEEALVHIKRYFTDIAASIDESDDPVICIGMMKIIPDPCVATEEYMTHEEIQLLPHHSVQWDFAVDLQTAIKSKTIGESFWLSLYNYQGQKSVHTKVKVYPDHLDVEPSAVKAELVDEINCIDLSPTGSLVFAGGNNGFAAIYDAKDLNKRISIKSLVGDVMVSRFFPSGKVTLTGGQDMTMKIWNLESLDTTTAEGPAISKPSQTLTGHRGTILDVAMIERGRNLVSASKDGSLRLWEESGVIEIFDLRAQKNTAAVNQLQFTNILNSDAHELFFVNDGTTSIPLEFAGVDVEPIRSCAIHVDTDLTTAVTGGRDGVLRRYTILSEETDQMTSHRLTQKNLAILNGFLLTDHPDTDAKFEFIWRYVQDQSPSKGLPDEDPEPERQEVELERGSALSVISPIFSKSIIDAAENARNTSKAEANEDYSKILEKFDDSGRLKDKQSSSSKKGRISTMLERYDSKIAAISPTEKKAKGKKPKRTWEESVAMMEKKKEPRASKKFAAKFRLVSYRYKEKVQVAGIFNKAKAAAVASEPSVSSSKSKVRKVYDFENVLERALPKSGKAKPASPEVKKATKSKAATVRKVVKGRCEEDAQSQETAESEAPVEVSRVSPSLRRKTTKQQRPPEPQSHVLAEPRGPQVSAKPLFTLPRGRRTKSNTNVEKLLYDIEVARSVNGGSTPAPDYPYWNAENRYISQSPPFIQEDAEEEPEVIPDYESSPIVYDEPPSQLRSSGANRFEDLVDALIQPQETENFLLVNGQDLFETATKRNSFYKPFRLH
ncbi:Proteasomal ATPase-associated factor 1 [Phlyctochytrium bullatum]|nr:Proteasomal ATPase-associated factor 1 [Phlyctochytrium bullatum]